MLFGQLLKKNPFKSKSSLSLEKRIKIAKKITQSTKFIKIKFYEDKIKSNKTIDLINHIKKNISLEINFYNGS